MRRSQDRPADRSKTDSRPATASTAIEKLAVDWGRLIGRHLAEIATPPESAVGDAQTAKKNASCPKE